MQRGTQVSLALWGMSGFALIFVALRVYIRTRIVRFFALEDYLYVSTFVWLLGFATSMQVAVHHGVGRNLMELSPDEVSNALFWSYIASSVVVSGNALAKLSMGFFLIRVVPHQKQRILLWILIAITVATSLALVVMIWNQTEPVKASWDVFRTPGTWKYDIVPLASGLGAWSSACDFFFAAFPWMFVWSLQMSVREKILLAGGMSLGVIAGACGIVRTVMLARSNKQDHTSGYSRYYIWAGAEVAVALICLAIPTLRPLYQKMRTRKTGGYQRTEEYARRHGHRREADLEDGEIPLQYTQKSADLGSVPIREELDASSEHINKNPETTIPAEPNMAKVCPSMSEDPPIDDTPATGLRPPPRPRNFSRVLSGDG